MRPLDVGADPLTNGIMVEAQAEAERRGHYRVVSDHILLKLACFAADVSAVDAGVVLAKLDVSATELRETIRGRMTTRPSSHSCTPTLSPQAERLLTSAAREAAARGLFQVTPAMLLLAMALDTESLAAQYLAGAGVDVAKLTQVIDDMYAPVPA